MLSLPSPSLLAVAVIAALHSIPSYAQLSDQEGSDTQQADKELEVIEVKGRAQTLYRASQSSVGTRTDTDLELVPQNIQVLPEALIRDQAARQVTDLYRSMSGVSAFSYSGVTFRGFRQDEILYDGVRGDPFNGFAVPQLFNVQEVQLLKGSSGALYGSSAPGGLINYVTKKPQRTAKNQLELGLGNDDYWQGSLELSGPLNEQQAYRFGYYRDSEQPFRWNTKVENEILDLGYLIDITDSTSLTLQYNTLTQDYQGARLRGVPTDDQGNFLGDRAWNHNEATDFQSLEADVWQVRADHEFNSNWRTDLTWRHYDNTELQNYHEPFCSFDTDGDGVVDYCRRQFRDQRRENTADSVTWNNIVEFSTAGLNHQLLIGADTMTQDSYFLGRNVAPIEQGGKALGISLINPVYGLTSAADYDIDSIKSTPTDTTAVRQGFYLQDQLDLTSSWNLLLGVRWDSFEDKNNMASSKVDGNDSSWRVGSTYQLTDWVRLYALKGTGFSPQASASQVPEVGGPFEAEQSSIIEAGARFSLLNDAIRLNVATYEMIRNNILQADPRGDVGGDGRDDQIALGEVKSKGVELDLLGDLTDSWVLNLNYAYNDTRIVESTSAITNAVGDKFANAPQHQVGIWSRYELDSINSAIAAGMDYVSDQLSIDGQHVKSYTVFDMSWQTRWQQWMFQANVKNLFDKTYATAGFIERTGHFPGEPRRLIVTASYQF
ncbi:TonB-dependent siderophore receptor [Rheinheimera tangshanensis]|uniref:TonB-dependent receptor n=1 Tax=Rheinheimera tangshanensis TaxID=400153 RepID=A0A5C8M3I9_9GAMM|nr:TonB-dependent receptor [Rheinheimera tangshanensis]TXK83025.1 TonB-dependent receptor [Rheinheimera tangshanensis]GGM46904.1 ligand-gated channel [Rheinheimera tangshanensis]